MDIRYIWYTNVNDDWISIASWSEVLKSKPRADAKFELNIWELIKIFVYDKSSFQEDNVSISSKMLGMVMVVGDK